MNNGKKPRLLLADDSVTIRKVVEMTFASEGIEVDAVGDAQSAMDRFVELHPDIVLVDTDLPGTNGYDMCEMIKRDESTRDIPVLLLVGSFEPFDHAAAERVGADGYLTKPFHSIRDLVTRVSDLLKKEDLQPPPETTDIDHLYEHSFSGEAATDTVDDLLGDAGLDDQLIETSSHNGSDNGLDSLVVFETETSESGFDWSPEAIVSQSVPDESPAAFEPRFTFAENDVEPPAAEAEQEVAETVEAPENIEEQPTAEGFIRITDEPWTMDEGPSRIEEAPQVEEPSPTLPVWAQEPVQTEEAFPTQHVASEGPDQTENLVLAASVSSQKPSPELVELVVNQVMEKLSDRVVREIAQEAVPRIAENLMREALEKK
jgi:CheY-like chemotaxis protein